MNEGDAYMRKLYQAIEERLKHLDFDKLWPGFNPVPFALYNQDKVYLKNEVIDRTSAFYGNTAIEYKGTPLAIWYIEKKYDMVNVDKLSSLIVHEMFHAYQNKEKDKRAPNEVKALDYGYDEVNLTLKNEEHRSMVLYYLHQREEDYTALEESRNYRKQHFPNAFDYETRLETHEGLAQYVELKALEQLNPRLAKNKVNKLLNRILVPDQLVPIRALCYDSGTTLMLIAEKRQIDLFHTIGKEEATLSDLLFNSKPVHNIDVEINPLITEAIEKHNQYKKDAIASIQNVEHTTLRGPFKLAGLDPFNTIKLDNTIYCKHFLAYFEQGEMKAVQQSCIATVNEDFEILEIKY